MEVKHRIAGKLEESPVNDVADINPARAFLAHGGKDAFPLAGGIEAVPLGYLADELVRG